MQLFRQNLTYQPDQEDTEQQQALVRIVLGVTVYILYYLFSQSGMISDIPESMARLIFIYIILSIVLYLWIRLHPVKSVLRRVIGMLLDITTVSLSMVQHGDKTAWLYGGYLWVAIANGLRFGRRYLQTGYLLSITGFGLALVFSDFWHKELAIGLGLMFWLLLLPIYASRLLGIAEAAVARAERSNRAKSQFLANMSHEIRTPLTSIIGYSETGLDSGQTNEGRMTALRTIRRSGEHLLNLINDILDFSKIEAGELDIENLAVNPMQCLAEVESIVLPQAEKKGLTFSIEYQFPLPDTITTDSMRLKQILLNLLNNAIKFTPDGSVVVTVHYHEAEHALEFDVNDTGIGINAEQLPKIFAPFKQADAGISRRFGGTGLGLSLSKRLAELLNGRLEVESKVGVGSVFKLILLDCVSPSSGLIRRKEDISVDLHVEAVNEAVAQFRGRVLLAEDNPTNQQLIIMYLRKMGLDVTLANNGKEALQLALQSPFDLIYMDMQMPVMSGVEAVERLRAADYQGPIVALTANATRDDRDLCLKAGFTEFMTKPIVRQRLQEVTAHFLPAQTNEKQELHPIQSQLMDDPEFTEIVANYVELLPLMLSVIRQAYATQDWEAFLRKLHDLKGSAGGYGYPQLTDLARQIELDFKQHGAESVSGHMQQLELIVAAISAGMP